MTVRSPHQALNRKIRLALGCRNGHQPSRTVTLRDGSLCCRDCQRDSAVARQAEAILGPPSTGQRMVDYLRSVGADFEEVRKALHKLPSSRRGSVLTLSPIGDRFESRSLGDTLVAEQDGAIWREMSV